MRLALALCVPIYAMPGFVIPYHTSKDDNKKSKGKGNGNSKMRGLFPIRVRSGSESQAKSQGQGQQLTGWWTLYIPPIAECTMGTPVLLRLEEEERKTEADPLRG